jgi:hypothetical protein
LEVTVTPTDELAIVLLVVAVVLVGLALLVIR